MTLPLSQVPPELPCSMGRRCMREPFGKRDGLLLELIVTETERLALARCGSLRCDFVRDGKDPIVTIGDLLSAVGTCIRHRRADAFDRLEMLRCLKVGWIATELARCLEREAST